MHRNIISPIAAIYKRHAIKNEPIVIAKINIIINESNKTSMFTTKVLILKHIKIK